MVDEILRRDINDQFMYPLGDTINLGTPFKNAPLLVFAVSRVFTRIVRELLEAGANPNVYGSNGASGLYTARGEKLDEIVTTLLQVGADPDNANFKGTISIHVVNSADFAGKLFEAGSNLLAKIHSNNPYNFTIGAIPLIISVDFGNLAVVKVIARYSTREDLYMIAADGKPALGAANGPYKPSSAQGFSSTLELLAENFDERVADIWE